MKQIKILCPNMQTQEQYICIQLSETDLLFSKAKKMILEKIKEIQSDEILFYSKTKNSIVRETDRVGKFCTGKEIVDLQLLMISDLVKVYQMQDQKNNMQSVKFSDEQFTNFEKELQKASNEKKELLNQLTNQNQNYQSQILLLQNQIASLNKEMELQRQSSEEKNKMKEEQIAQFLLQCKQEQSQVQILRLQQLQQNKDKDDLLLKLKEKNLEINDNMIHIEQLNQTIERIKNQLLASQKDGGVMKSNYEFDQLFKQEQFYRQKEQQKNAQLQHEIEKLQASLSKYIEDLQVVRSKTESEYQYYQRQIENLQQKCKYAQEEIKQAQKEKEQIKIQLFNEKKNGFNKDGKIEELEYYNQKKDKMINELEYEKTEQRENFQKFLKAKEDSIQKLMENDDKLQTQSKLYEEQISQIKKELKRAQNKITDLEGQVDRAQKTIIELQNQIKQLQDEFLNKKKDFEVTAEKMMKALDKEALKANQEQEKKQQLVKRIKQNQLRKIASVAVIGATEALLTAMKNPTDFLKNENIMTNEIIAKVDILRVDETKAIERLTKNEDTDLSDLVKSENVGQWTFKKSIAINGEGTKRQAFLAQVIACDRKEFSDQLFVIKELAGFEKIATIEKAIYVASNMIISRVLANYFRERFTCATMEKCPCQFNYPEPFLIQSDSYYFIAEPFVQGNFQKLQGEGQDPNITSFFNAFSVFTYKATQQMLMVSNIQGILNDKKYVLCDPILSSPEGILGSEDLGEGHILSFLDKIKANPDSKCNKYLNKMNIKL